MRRPIRVYVDTSVFGGVFDEEFAKASRKFFELADQGEFQIVISGLVRTEMLDAPEDVRGLFETISSAAESVDVTEEAVRLAKAYIDVGVLSENWQPDALHVATATVAQCDLIISWNFKHIVNYRRVRGYNAVNILEGYRSIAIHSPMEVIAREED
jgi:predicted nucleic acid-binding protein